MNDKHDDSFEEFSAGDEALHDALAAADRALEPDAATDAAILAAARRSVGARPEALGWAARHPLVRPLATAALLVLSVGVVTLLVEQDHTAPSLPRPAAPAVDDARFPADIDVAPERRMMAPAATAAPPMSYGETGAAPATEEEPAALREVYLDAEAAGARAGGKAMLEPRMEQAAPVVSGEAPIINQARRRYQPPAGAARQAAPDQEAAVRRAPEMDALESVPAEGAGTPRRPETMKAPATALQAPPAVEAERAAEDDSARALQEIVALCRDNRPYQAVLERFRLRYPGIDEARLRAELGDCYLPSAR